MMTLFDASYIVKMVLVKVFITLEQLECIAQ